MIRCIYLHNFRLFKEFEIKIYGNIPTIVGKNDVGKSSILHALDIFFGNRRVSPEDLYKGADTDNIIEIGICLKIKEELSKIELEEGVKTSLQEENLLYKEGDESLLYIIKRFNLSNRIEDIFLVVYDYDNEDLSALATKGERELNALLQKYNLESKRSGRGITNKSRRIQLRRLAESMDIPKKNIRIPIRGTKVDKVIKSILERYTFILYPAEQPLDAVEKPLMPILKPILKTVLNKVGEEDKVRFEDEIKFSLADELKQIGDYIREIGVDLDIAPRIIFQWDRLVDVEIEAGDNIVNVPIIYRGVGIRRVMLVAVFRWLADKLGEGRGISKYIFAIEEPEAFLHPSLIHKLTEYLKMLSENNVQIFITTHSDKVVAKVSEKDLIFIDKNAEGRIHIDIYPDVNVLEVARALGVSSRSELLTKKLVIFVEGRDDKEYFEALFKKLFELGKFKINPSRILLIPSGGYDNILTLIEIDDLVNLGKKFLVIIDNNNQNIGKLKSKLPSDDYLIILDKEDILLYLPKEPLLKPNYKPRLLEKLRSIGSNLNEFNENFGLNIGYTKSILRSLGKPIEYLILRSTYEELKRVWSRDNREMLTGIIKHIESFCNENGI